MMRRFVLLLVFMLFTSAACLAEPSVYAVEGETDSPRVMNLQEVLTTCGYYNGEINGSFDHAFVSALRALFLEVGRELTLDDQLKVVVTADDWAWLLRTDLSRIQAKDPKKTPVKEEKTATDTQSKEKPTEEKTLNETKTAGDKSQKDAKASEGKSEDEIVISAKNPSSERTDKEEKSSSKKSSKEEKTTQEKTTKEKTNKEEKKTDPSKGPEIDEALLADPVYSKIKAGQIITFGRYPQTVSGKTADDVEWIVLDVKKDQALLVSRYALDMRQYNDEYTDTTWSSCSLRTWLNEEFMRAAFTEWEQERILVKEIDNDQGYSMFAADGGKDTSDRVFLLSYKEASSYLNDAVCFPTEYAIKQGISEGRWWLRSPGAKQNGAAVINKTGDVTYENANEKGIGVRPALWINTTIDSRTTICNANKVNIRIKPDSSASSLGKVNRDDRIVLLEKGKEWSLIQFRQMIGYIMTKYIGQE